MIALYGIPNCDTVAKSTKWLKANGKTYQFHDFKAAPPSVEALKIWADAVSFGALLNKKSTTWRNLEPKVQASITDTTAALELLNQYPTLIKRPVVEWPNGAITVGFDAAAWAELA